MTPDVHALTGPYVLNALPDDERHSFEQHLADCQSCQAEVAELREAANRLGNTTAMPPPPSLKARVLTAAETTRQLPPTIGAPTPLDASSSDLADRDAPPPGAAPPDPALPDPAHRDAAQPHSMHRDTPPDATPPDAADREAVPPDAVPPDAVTPGAVPHGGVPSGAAPPGGAPHGGVPFGRRVRSRRSLFGLAAAGLAVATSGAIAVDQYRDASKIREQNEQLAAILAESDARTVHGSVTGGGRATVVRSVRRDAAVVLLQDLSQPPEGRTYQLWLIDRSQTARSLGLADGGSSQTVVDGGVADKVTFGLTLEPTGGSRTPTEPAVTLVGLT